MTDNTPEGLPPLADLSEALARGREPRKLWPVLHSVDDTTKSDAIAHTDADSPSPCRRIALALIRLAYAVALVSMTRSKP